MQKRKRSIITRSVTVDKIELVVHLKMEEVQFSANEMPSVPQVVSYIMYTAYVSCLAALLFAF